MLHFAANKRFSYDLNR